MLKNWKFWTLLALVVAFVAVEIVLVFVSPWVALDNVAVLAGSIFGTWLYQSVKDLLKK